jgi:transglutaminase-like putative cysteine protease
MSRAWLLASAILVGIVSARVEGQATRAFELTYTARLTELPAGEIRLWMPVPPDTGHQKIRRLRFTIGDLPPRMGDGPAWELRETLEGRYGNRVLFAAGRSTGEPVAVSYSCEVERSEVKLDQLHSDAPLAENRRTLYLRGDRLAPVEGVATEWAEKAAGGSAEPMAAARKLYDRVMEHMRYSKDGTGWGQGSLEWACTQGYGNCTDFHALFTSMARARKIPCRFEIGFSVPTERPEGEIPGYHCWAWFHVEGKGWVPVDISEADKNPQLTDYYFGSLTADRVQLSVGRDLELTPAPREGPLNFFVYPHVEVNGVKHAKVERKVTYRDVAPNR